LPILLDKLLTALILPISVTLVLGFVAAAGLLRGGRRGIAGLMLILSLGTLWVFSTPLTAQLLLASLERQYVSFGP
jgi:hypothetical protein